VKPRLKLFRRAVVRVLLAWMLMLALPFSGPAHAQARALAGPCAHTHTQAQAHAHAQAAHDAHATHGAKACAGTGKAGGCGACCLGAALAPAAMPNPLPDRPDCATIPFRAPALPSGWAALPERPPRLLSA